MGTKIQISYHKVQFRMLVKEYIRKLSDLECGRELAKYMFGFEYELEQKMDIHIKAINKLDNKTFKTFEEGYVPSGILN